MLFLLVVLSNQVVDLVHDALVVPAVRKCWVLFPPTSRDFSPPPRRRQKTTVEGLALVLGSLRLLL